MIVGLGIDVVALERMRRAFARHGARLWERVLTEVERRELEGAPDPALALAGRFAVKEAFSKALGAPQDVWWHDVAVRRAPTGQPTLEFHGAGARRTAELGVRRAHVSLTHDAGVAAAVVILEGA